MRQRILLPMLAAFSVLLAGCAASVQNTETAVPAATVTAAPTPSPTAAAGPTVVELLPDEDPPPTIPGEFDTDFGRHTVPYDEILSGGPPRDGIPSISDPKLISVSEANSWIEDNEPVVVVEVDNVARAYPLQILTWHEIVNDELNGVPVTVTFCPLCNTGIAFDRRHDGQVLSFGTSGRLRYSNMVMYDHQTHSWWQQATGEGIAGEYAGSQLDLLPASIVSWQSFRETFADGTVVSRETGYERPYGQNPYIGYDDVNESPFLYQGPPTPGKLRPMDRVLTVERDSQAVAYPYDTLEAASVINDEVAGEPLALFWQPGAASALDRSQITEGREVGSALAYHRTVGDRVLTFAYRDGPIIDNETKSVWDTMGHAISGELAGQRLAPAVSVNHFWFSWAAFRPDTRVYVVE